MEVITSEAPIWSPNQRWPVQLVQPLIGTQHNMNMNIHRLKALK